MTGDKALLIAQALLMMAGSRLKLEAVHSVGADYFAFYVAGRRRIGSKVVMPVVYTPRGMAILSLLDETRSKERRWFINGQASVGFKQITHYGHYGQVVCLLSKAEMAVQYGAGAVDDPTLSEATRSCIAQAPEATTLEVFDEDLEPTRLEVPTDLEARVLCRALNGEPQYVDTKEDRFKALVKIYGLRLFFGTGDNQGLIGNAQSAMAA